MATEATSENFATTSTTPDILEVSGSSTVNDSYTLLTLRQNSNPETSSQDVPSEILLSIEQPINGIIEKDGANQETTEAAVTSAEVSVSGGSDTEASKAEATKAGLDEKGHIRSASVKKPASFKPVSVNKTFLAAKGASSAAPSKLGDKPVTGTTMAQTASTLVAPRPRLVAKTGSGLRDSTPRTSSAGNGGKAGAAPDASAVWNKNRRTLQFINFYQHTNIEKPHLLQSPSDSRTKNSNNVMVYTWLRGYNLMIQANRRIGRI